MDVKLIRRISLAAAFGLLSVPIVSAQTVAVGDAPAESSARLLAGIRVTCDVDRVPLERVLRMIAQQGNLRLSIAEDALPLMQRVTLHVHDVSAAEALKRVLLNTNAKATVIAGVLVFERLNRALSNISRGGVTGTVTDVATHRPLRGALVTVDAAAKGVTTSDDGTYQLPDLTGGIHVIHVRLLGYLRATTTVTVVDGQTTTANVTLEPSASVLSQVVVTGTVVQTELKAVPNAITVITAQDIAQRGIVRIDQLFRGDVPGLFVMQRGANASLDEVTMFSRGATALSSSSTGGSSPFLTNPIKTYIDGVEVADAQYVNQIDPRSIERIEILTGPQASTIYGSNAINGVMQIFTKRGTSNTPQLTLNLLSGWVENNFSSARTPQHDYSVQLNGIEGRISYNAGGAWNYIGPWTPAKQTTRITGFGGTRLEVPTRAGTMTADLTWRRSNTSNKQRGDAVQGATAYRETGWYTNFSSSGLTSPATATIVGQTLGFTLMYVPTPWWSHEFGMGQDVSDTERRITARGYQFTYDTTLALSQNYADRRSLHYTTTLRFPITSLVQATVTTGADGWQSMTSSWSVQPQTLTGSLIGATAVARQPGHNTGGFVQTQVGIHDRLFVTSGLRAEWNPNYGANAQPNYAPRYGIAYTQEAGLVTAKLRASYGRSTRPPQTGLKATTKAADAFGGSSSIISTYGNFDYTIANPELAPEYQQGGEGGLELYLGNRGSLIITRYNQTINGLIAKATVDSVRSLIPNPLIAGLTCAQFLSIFGSPSVYCSSQDAAGFWYVLQYQNVNLGSIRNQGWELQGSVNTGPFTTKGTYSWTKSRTIGVEPKYRALFGPNNYPQYQAGATFQYVPEHTWAMHVTYAQPATHIEFGVTGVGQVRNLYNDLFYQSLHPSIRLMQNRMNLASSTSYVSMNRGYVEADLVASHRFVRAVDGVIQIQNLTNRYTNDYAASYTAIGRQAQLGLRVAVR